jgi:two-component system NtrC family sensor kinase
MKSLRSVLIAWFLFFSLVPVFLVTFFLIRSFDTTYRRETELRLASVVQEIESKLVSDQKFLLDSLVFWQSEAGLKNIISRPPVERSKAILRLIDQRALDGIAIYDRSGVLSVSYQKDDQGNWVPFPNIGSSQIYYLPKDQLKKVKESNPYFAIKTYPKRKVVFSLFKKLLSKKDIIIEMSKYIQISDFDLIRSRRQVDLMLLDANLKTILSNWIDAPRSVNFFNDIVKADTGLISRDIEGEEKLILSKQVKWGDSDLFLLAISPKQTWNEAIHQIRFYVVLILIAITVVLILAVTSVTSNIITPLKNLLGVTRKILYENVSVQLEAGPYDEITSLSTAITELSRNIYRAQDDLLKKIEQLKATQTQLVQSEKLNSLGLLVAGIAHEINNPIGFIYSNIKPLKDHFIKIEQAILELPEGKQIVSELSHVFQDIPKLIQSFEEGSLRIKKIVEGLRTFSRQSSDQSEVISVKQLLDSTLVLLSHEFKSRDIEILINLQKDYSIIGNTTELSQVLLNILMNAAQAIQKHGRITILVGNAQGLPREAVSIAIQDSGPGIPPDIQARIFEPFFTTKSPGEGTGLGLSISYGIIQKHQGQIILDSMVGGGSTFTIVLPLAKKE